jgi:hypothetical protein
MMRIGFGVCLFALASSASSQLAVGTWNKRGDHPMMLMIIEPAGNATQITYKVLAPDGKALPQAVMTLVTQLDGNEVPVLVNGKPSGETMAIRRIDERHTSTIVKMNGTPFGTSKSELSADGKTLRVENTTSGDPQGQSAGTKIEYWDRQ